MIAKAHAHSDFVEVVHKQRTALVAYAALAGTVIIPHVVVGGVAVGADDIATPVLLAILSVALLQRRNLPLAPTTIVIAYLWFAILIHGVLMGIAASAQYLGEASIPTEMWQYVKRLAFFYASFGLAASHAATVEAGYKSIVSVLLVATIIGLLQIGTGAISETLSSVYARTDVQLEMLVSRELATRRTYGVAGNSGAWGGFCMFAASVALPFVLTRADESGGRARLWRSMCAILLLLAAVNLLFSASRGALVAFIFVLLMKGVLEPIFRQGGVVAFAKWLGWAAAMAAAALYFALDRLALLAYRFLTLAEQGGGTRVDQVASALSLIDSASASLSGVGNAVQRAFSVSHGVEVEPVYIFVNYGLIGAVCRYGLLLIVGVVALQLMRSKQKWDSGAGMAALLSLAGYAVFSTGYFFFQELYVGVVPWLVLGMVAGIHQRIWLGFRPVAPGLRVARPAHGSD